MKVWRLAMLVALSMLVAGCWDRVEVNDLAIVTGVALDKAGPQSIKMTVSIVVPANVTPPGSPGGSSEPANTTKAAVGRTVSEVITRLQELTPRRLYWAHNAVILLGEQLAREGVAPWLDFFSRQRQPRLGVMVAVVRGRAADILATFSPLEKNVPVSIEEQGALRVGPSVRLLEFLEMLASDGHEPYAARFEIVTTGAKEPETFNPQAGNSGSQSSGGGMAAADAAQNPSQAAIAGAALFKRDRLIGFLDDKEARGLLGLRNELQTATVTVTLGTSGKWVGLRLVKATTQMKPRFEGDRLIMEITVKSVNDIHDNSAGVDAGDPVVIALLEEELAETIGVRVKETFHRIQHDFGSDVFGFGEVVKRTNPQRWQRLRHQWDEVFRTVELDLRVQAKIRETGLSTTPLGLQTNDVVKAEQLKRMLAGQ